MGRRRLPAFLFSRSWLILTGPAYPRLTSLLSSPAATTGLPKTMLLGTAGYWKGPTWSQVPARSPLPPCPWANFQNCEPQFPDLWNENHPWQAYLKKNQLLDMKGLSSRQELTILMIPIIISPAPLLSAGQEPEILALPFGKGCQFWLIWPWVLSSGGSRESEEAWAFPSCRGFSLQLSLIKFDKHFLTPTRCRAWCQVLAVGRRWVMKQTQG